MAEAKFFLLMTETFVYVGFAKILWLSVTDQFHRGYSRRLPVFFATKTT